MFHYPAEITQTNHDWWLQHIHSQDREKVLRSMEAALQNGMEFWSKEYRFERADHTYAHIMDRGYILQNGDGKPWRVIGAMLDLTERQRAEDTIRQQNDMLSSLHYMTINLLRHRELSQLLNSLVEFATSFLDAPYAEIMLVEADQLVVRAVTQNQQSLIGQRLNRDEAVLSWQAFDTHEPAVLSDYSIWPKRQKAYQEYSLHAVADFPILNEEQCLGVLALGRDRAGYEFTSDQIQYGRFFANLTALVLSNVQLRETLQEQSIRDPLTGLFNRRYMEETLQRELRRVTRQLGPLGIIMIDIDHFKQFNDTYGHSAGDRALRRLGHLLQNHVRGEDVACRYGGEEFILIMPNTSADVVVKRAEYLRQAATGLRIAESDATDQHITLSLGIAIYPEHGRTIDAVLGAADTALYHAKKQGRNRVVVASQ
jgi:diguanylate cyclase (GGDEF)-like protein